MLTIVEYISILISRTEGLVVPLQKAPNLFALLDALAGLFVPRASQDLRCNRPCLFDSTPYSLHVFVRVFQQCSCICVRLGHHGPPCCTQLSNREHLECTVQ